MAGLRICHFDRFPYSLLYDENQARGLVISAVAHRSREPGYWTDRTA